MATAFSGNLHGECLQRQLLGSAAASRGSTQPLSIKYFRNRLCPRYLGSNTTRHSSYTDCASLNRPELTWNTWGGCQPQTILLKKFLVARLVQKFTFLYFCARRLYSVRFEFVTVVDEVMAPLRRSVVLNAKQLENILKGIVPSS